jgi:uncharacterized protein
MYFKVYKDVANLWRWTLKAANHHTVADSGESYHNKSDALYGISLVKGATQAPVYE